MNEKILTTSKLPKREVEDRVVPSQGFIQTARPAAMSKEAYIAKYATEAEKDELIGVISRRRAKLPKFIYFVCQKCSWKSKMLFGDRDVRKSDIPDYCLKCNPMRFKDGGVMREMTKKEVQAYEKELAEKKAREENQLFKAGLFNRNQERQRQGLPTLSEKEYRAEMKAEWERINRPGGR